MIKFAPRYPDLTRVGHRARAFLRGFIPAALYASVVAVCALAVVSYAFWLGFARGADTALCAMGMQVMGEAEAKQDLNSCKAVIGKRNPYDMWGLSE